MKSKLLIIAGIVISALAWCCMIFVAVEPEPILKLLGLTGVMVGQYHLLTIAQSALFTGIALALGGLLAQGFGALDRFFQAALARSARPQTAPAPDPEPATRRVLEEGLLAGRIYSRYSDGTIEVETLMGARQFKSMMEAEAFLGGDQVLLRRVA